MPILHSISLIQLYFSGIVLSAKWGILKGVVWTTFFCKFCKVSLILERHCFLNLNGIWHINLQVESQVQPQNEQNLDVK